MLVALIGLQPTKLRLVLNQKQLSLNWGLYFSESCFTYSVKQWLVQTALLLITHFARVLCRLLSRGPLLPLALLAGPCTVNKPTLLELKAHKATLFIYNLQTCEESPNFSFECSHFLSHLLCLTQKTGAFITNKPQTLSALC